MDEVTSASASSMGASVLERTEAFSIPPLRHQPVTAGTLEQQFGKFRQVTRAHDPLKARPQDARVGTPGDDRDRIALAGHKKSPDRFPQSHVPGMLRPNWQERAPQEMR